MIKGQHLNLNHHGQLPLFENKMLRVKSWNDVWKQKQRCIWKINHLWMIPYPSLLSRWLSQLFPSKAGCDDLDAHHWQWQGNSQIQLLGIDIFGMWPTLLFFLVLFLFNNYTVWTINCSGNKILYWHLWLPNFLILHQKFEDCADWHLGINVPNVDGGPTALTPGPLGTGWSGNEMWRSTPGGGVHPRAEWTFAD